MNILIIGYGKMGKTIEKIVIDRGHTIANVVDKDTTLKPDDIKNADVAIEFTQPEAAYDNVKFCLDNSLPIISGTTGWLEKKSELETYCQEKDGTFFYASNFSIGVNIFFRINEILARMMNKFPEYDVVMEETHHTEKRDSPSGTAITLAEGVIENYSKKQIWANEPTEDIETLDIISFRKENIPGTHVVKYQSVMDEIMIKHTAHKRESFALGVVLVSEWIAGRKGVLSMKDFLKF